MQLTPTNVEVLYHRTDREQEICPQNFPFDCQCTANYYHPNSQISSCTEGRHALLCPDDVNVIPDSFALFPCLQLDDTDKEHETNDLGFPSFCQRTITIHHCNHEINSLAEGCQGRLYPDDANATCTRARSFCLQLNGKIDCMHVKSTL